MLPLFCWQSLGSLRGLPGGKFLDTKIQRSYRSFTGDSSGWVTPARLGGRFLESPIFQSGMMSKIPGI